MTAIKERPILFSALMVRAILDGRKTVTRRPVKGSTLKWLEEFVPEFVVHTANGLCPFGQTGERLWVRETWYCDHNEVMRGPYLKPDDLDVSKARDDGTLVYAADGLTPYETDQPVWKPSIHMPRWACPILLEITDVRVERLHAITDQQCAAEGCAGGHGSIPGYIYDATPQEHFRHIWESTGGDYHANPWVWVVEFRRVTP